MKKLFAAEMKRAFQNRRTLLVLFAGCLISMIQIVRNILPGLETWNEMALNLKADNQYPYHLFNRWMCGTTGELEGFLYFLVIPLLAVLPYSLSFLEDKTSGYVKQMYTRCDRRSYLTAKFGAVFIVGGTVVTLPLLLNFLICAMLLPALLPQNLEGTFVNAHVLWYHIYETQPLLYVLIFLLIDFIYAGLLAVLPLFFSFYSEKKFVILLMPFVIHIFSYSVGMMIPHPLAIEYSPVLFTFAANGCPSGWILAGYGIVYFGLGGLVFWKIGRQEDIF